MKNMKILQVLFKKVLIDQEKEIFDLSDMEWAFRQGIHEGYLRRMYEDSDDKDSFIESDLKFYIQSYYNWK